RGRYRASAPGCSAVASPQREKGRAWAQAWLSLLSQWSWINLQGCFSSLCITLLIIAKDTISSKLGMVLTNLTVRGGDSRRVPGAGEARPQTPLWEVWRGPSPRRL